MNDEQRTREELIREIDELRQRVVMLEQRRPCLDAEHDPSGGSGARLPQAVENLPDEDLRESEARCRNLSEAAFDAMAIHEGGRILEGNSKFFQMFGYEPHEIIGKNALHLSVAPESRDLVRQYIQCDRQERYEAVGMRKDGSRFPMEVIVRSWEFKGKTLRAAAIRDITERKRAEEQSCEREEILRLILDASPVGIGYAEDRRLNWCNRMMAEMFGFESQEDFMGKSTRIMYPSDEEYNRVGRVLYQGLKSGMTRGTDALFARKDGSIFHGHIKISAPDPATPTKRTVATISDISIRKQAEEALRKSEERFRAIYENAPVMIDAFAPDGTVLSWNRETERRLGWTMEEAQSIDVLARCYPDRQQLQEVRHSVALADGRFREFRPLDKNGCRRTQLWANFRLPDGNVISVGHDISELRESQSSLELQQKRFEVLAKHAPFGLVMIGRGGTYSYVNPKFLELFGYELDEVPNGREFCRRAFPDADYRVGVVSRWKKDLEEAEIGELRPRVFRVTCKDGSVKEIHFRPVQLDTGEHFMTCEDVTERKRAERDLKRALENSLRLRQEAEAANTAKSNFLAGMSHEIRTPLNAVIGFSEILQDQVYGPLNDKQLRFVRYTLESGRHLLQLIEDVLDLAKVESGKMKLEREPVNLIQLLENGLSMIRERAAKGSIELEHKIDNSTADLEIRADNVKLRQVLYNLLANAVNFTPQGGTVRVEAEVNEADVVISVIDTGIGIDRANQKRIFEAFEQVDSSFSRRTPGTGLGLALSRRLVELHGGEIRVESQGKGKGSTFSFTIPIADDN
ncbi:MAG: PAS domain S-box protein [Pseudomonadota bacterium]